jgi:hypothetical protein
MLARRKNAASPSAGGASAPDPWGNDQDQPNYFSRPPLTLGELRARHHEWRIGGINLSPCIRFSIRILSNNRNVTAGNSKRVFNGVI